MISQQATALAPKEHCFKTISNGNCPYLVLNIDGLMTGEETH